MVTASGEKARIEQLLAQWSSGDQSCEEELIKLIYPDIHHLAKKQLKKHNAKNMQTTEIANEAYLQLKFGNKNWESQSHFLAIVAKVVRYIVFSEYRSSQAQKRGGQESHLTLERLESVIDDGSSRMTWYELSRLLDELDSINKEAADVVVYKFYGGMTMGEIAAVMGKSEATTTRLWTFAKLWLKVRVK